MKQPNERDLISQFDKTRTEYLNEEKKLRDHYFPKFQSLLAQIAKIRRLKEDEQ